MERQVSRPDAQKSEQLNIEPFTTADLATRIAGSSDLFQNNGRKPWNSINFIDVHDGLTLADVYRYNDGDEVGPRRQSRLANRRCPHWSRARSLNAGTSMFAGGGGFLRSQNGNNNAYKIDTAANWLNYNWTAEQKAFHAYAQSLIAFRKNHAALRPADFYTAQQLQWYQPAGAQADTAYFTNPDNHAIGWWLNGTALGDTSPALFIAYNAWSGAVTFNLPAPPPGKSCSASSTPPPEIPTLRRSVSPTH